MNSKSYKCTATAVCIALCIMLPLALHTIPNSGVLFSPMHLPVLLCGMICGPGYGLICGFCGPLFSGILTGMPSMGYLPTMILELATYGLFSGLMMLLLHTGKALTDVYVSLLTAMLTGRIITGLARAFLFTPGSYSLKLWATGYFVSCFPAIMIQLLIIPILYLALQHSGLVPNRDRR